MTLTQTRPDTSTLQPRERWILLAHAFVAWALCTASMGIGQAVTTVDAALIIHAIGAPIFSGAVSWNYYKRYGHATPLQTAVTFVGFVMVVDFFVVALAVLRSLEMFASPIGTWIPFLLIFSSTYLTGRAMQRRTKVADRTQPQLS